MYKSLIFTAVVLFDGVAAQNTDVGGIKYRCVESIDNGKECDIEVTNDFTQSTLDWQTLLDGAADLDFNFDNLVRLRVANCESLQEINFSDAPSQQTISYPSGGGGLELTLLPNLHTIHLGEVTEVGDMYWVGIGTSLDDYALNVKAPHLHTVRRQLSIGWLSIDVLRFDALEFIGDKDPSSQAAVQVFGSSAEYCTDINTISLPVVERVHSINISDAESVGSISGLFKDDTDTMFEPSVFVTGDGVYDGLITISIVFDTNNFKFNYPLIT